MILRPGRGQVLLQGIAQADELDTALTGGNLCQLDLYICENETTRKKLSPQLPTYSYRNLLSMDPIRAFLQAKTIQWEVLAMLLSR